LTFLTGYIKVSETSVYYAVEKIEEVASAARRWLLGRYVVRKLLVGILTVVLVMTLNFVLMHAAPGDPVTYMMGKDAQNFQQREALMEKYGLNQSLPVQYFKLLGQYVTGDFGTSIVYNRPVTQIIGEKLGPTLALVLVASLLGLVIGTAMGVSSARREGSAIDFVYSGGAYVANAMPGFWVGLMLIIVCATTLGWVPTSGMVDLRAGYSGFRKFLDILHHMILPMLTLVIVDVPQYFRIAKSSVLQVNSEEYITTFRAAGMSERKIFRKYVLKNAILPVITVFGITMAYLIAGVSLVEIVFAWPGTGRVMMSAIMQRDYPVLMGIYLIMSIMVAITMILVDLVYATLDPRIRY
jgi:peptide/nickel transport system permease protein